MPARKGPIRRRKSRAGRRAVRAGAAGKGAPSATDPGVAAPGAAVPAAFEIERHVFFWFTWVMSRRDRQLNAALRPFGLRVPEWRVLGALHCRRGMSMSELADTAAIDPTTLSRTVDALVRDGLLMRLTDVEDKRVTRLALTAEGTRLALRVVPLVIRLNDIACAGLPPALVDLLCWAMGQMRKNLDASLDDPALLQEPAAG